MNLLLRRNKSGLETLRKIRLSSSNPRMYDIMNDQHLRINPRVRYNYLINWAYVRDVPNGFTRVLNNPRNVGISSSKGTFRKKLYDNGLTMRTWNVTNRDNVPAIVDSFEVGKEYIIRPQSHYGGKNMFTIKYQTEANELLKYTLANRYFNMFGGNYYISEYINKDKEFRVFVLDGRIVFVVEKIVEDTTAKAWNVEQGGRFENVRFGSWNLEVCRKAIDAIKLAGLDFGAVDVMSKGDEVYVLEVNTSPHITADYWSSCVAKAFDYTINNGVMEPFNINMDNAKWRNFVHPALSDEAIL